VVGLAGVVDAAGVGLLQAVIPISSVDMINRTVNATRDFLPSFKCPICFSFNVYFFICTINSKYLELTYRPEILKLPRMCFLKRKMKLKESYYKYLLQSLSFPCQAVSTCL
jgi:hypothetical protein